MVHRALKSCSIVALGKHDSGPPEKIKDWVSQASGKISFNAKLNPDTTHLVVSDKKWQEQGPVVQDAIKHNKPAEPDARKIHIVSYDWLIDSVMAKAHRAENKYSWLEKAKSSALTSSKSAPRSTVGLMSQVFMESTDKFLSDAMKRKMEKRRQLEEESRREEEARVKEQFDKQRETANLKALMECLKRGVIKGRNELLTDKYHMYVDGMGFTWDVVLEPCEWTGNVENRSKLSLQIYESKSKPPTYAFNAKANGTKKIPQNNAIVAMGCNFLTAFRLLRSIFKEKTGVEWASRMDGADVRGAEFKYVPPTEDAMEMDGHQQSNQSPKKGKSPQGSQRQRTAAHLNVFGGDSDPLEVLSYPNNGGIWNFSDAPITAQGSSILGKRKPVEHSGTEHGAMGKLKKLKEARANHSQDTTTPMFAGEAYAYGSASNPGTDETFPRAMDDVQLTNEGEDEADKFFDFSMGETI